MDGTRSWRGVIGTALSLATYAALLSWGPDIARPSGLLVQVVAQKAAAVVLIAAILVAAAEVDWAERQAETGAVPFLKNNLTTAEAEKPPH